MKEQQKVKDKEENKTKWDIWHVPKSEGKKKSRTQKYTVRYQNEGISSGGYGSFAAL